MRRGRARPAPRPAPSQRRASRLTHASPVLPSPVPRPRPQRAWVDTDIASVRVKCVVECADRAAGVALFEALEAKGYRVDMQGQAAGVAAVGAQALAAAAASTSGVIKATA